MSHATAQLPESLYRAEQVREMDRRAIEDRGIAGYTLMQRAAAAVYRACRARWPEARNITVLCGPGNNGGDGYLVAALAAADGLEVQVLTLGDVARLKGDALEASRAARQARVPIRAYAGEARLQGALVVDALFGTGLDRDVDGEWRAAIEAVNASACAVLAVDIPSGLHADTGAILGRAVRADATVTFIGLKQGLFTGQGTACSGRVLFHSLEVAPELYADLPPSAHRLEFGRYARALAPRGRGAHKGDFGHLLVVGGDAGYLGAVRLAAMAGARCGAGLVSVATRDVHAALVGVGCPELMARGVATADLLQPMLERAGALILGPGLGCAAWARALWQEALSYRKPLVLDADGLNLLAMSPRRRDDWILTPHPGEAARLLGTDAAGIERDRFGAVRELQRRYGGEIVLKGAGTLICGPDHEVYLCAAGNPGMASGGMGDVLSGVIGALLAQGLDPAVAARLGVCLHAGAADRAAADGERGLLASDLFPHLRRLVNPGR